MKKNESSLTLLIGVMLLIGAPILFYAANALSILGPESTSTFFDVASLVSYLAGVCFFGAGFVFLVVATFQALSTLLRRWILSIARSTSGA
jgi:hypothetical protein